MNVERAHVAVGIALVLSVALACKSRPATRDASPVASPSVSPPSAKPEMTIEVDAARLAAFGVALGDVQSALAGFHVTPATPTSFVVETTHPPADVLDTVISAHSDVPIHLRDLARVSRNH